jgi:signal transduction histidine kinase
LAAGIEEAQAESRAKNALMAGVSHDLRTPLNAVIGFSDLLRTQSYGPLNPKQLEYIEDIRSSGEHLLALVNDILDFSKSEAGRLSLQYHRFEVNPIVEECLKMLRLRAEEGGLTLGSELHPDLIIEADPRRLRQMVMNLLSNAIKFTPDGGVVKLTTSVYEDSALFTVLDTGVGIASEDLGKLFTPFVQVGAHPAPLGHDQGTGLGLALSQRLAKLHGGDITVTSSVGAGSSFCLRLPVSRG